MSIQKYPVGHQDFAKIIEEQFLYIDKTPFAYKLAERGGYYFLSRPRRFGKSLFISTLEYLFKGKKALFDNLYISDKWKFEEFPVIKMSFSRLSYENNSLVMAIKNELNTIAHSYDIELTQSEAVKDLFDQLIKLLKEKFNKQVVVLIDEYDKPLIDYLDKENLHKALENRSILKSFYSILKDADAHLKLVFITGVSKFSQVSIFSDLNNLYDLTLLSEYNEICGISQKELESNFVEELKLYNKEEIRSWYNGYRWHLRGETVYNPFSLLNFFSGGGDFKNFWYTTGTPTFLMNMCKEQGLYELRNVSLSQTALNSFDIDRLNIIPVLFQTGYLTVKSYNEVLKIYHLDYPNNEVKSSFIEGLLEVFSGSKEPISSTILDKIYTSFTQQAENDLRDAMNLVFAHIPYDLWIKESEKYYHLIIHLTFTLLGVNIESQVHTKNGRADVIVVFENNVYCMEFKLDKSAESAIAQIDSRGFLDKYKGSQHTLHKIGINFSSAEKKVSELIWLVEG
jgi:hypothetical protein